MSILPTSGSLPDPHTHPPSKGCCCHVLPAIHQAVRCRSRTLSFQLCNIFHLLNFWCLCHWLWAFSLVLRLGKYRACRPARYSPMLCVWDIGQKKRKTFLLQLRTHGNLLHPVWRNFVLYLEITTRLAHDYLCCDLFNYILWMLYIFSVQNSYYAIYLLKTLQWFPFHLL